jgi:ribosome biogenesis GTPase
MYFLENGGIVIDNPGVREVGLADADNGVTDFFDEIASLSEHCKYADCAHTGEPGCAVLAAVKSGELDEEKYSNYVNLKKETEYSDMSDTEKKEKNRHFGKFINKAKKDLKKIGHKDY